MISHNEAQELHRLIGSALTDLSCMTGATSAAVRVELDGPLTRALELAAILVSDTVEGGRDSDPQPIHLYLTGDTDAPNIYAVVYDDEDEAMEAGRENCLAVFRVPFIPQLDQAVCIHDAEEDDDE